MRLVLIVFQKPTKGKLMPNKKHSNQLNVIELDRNTVLSIVTRSKKISSIAQHQSYVKR
jgi:hypothetical protein